MSRTGTPSKGPERVSIEFERSTNSTAVRRILTSRQCRPFIHGNHRARHIIEHSSAPLEGVVVLIVDTPDCTRILERPLAEAGAAVFIAHDQKGISVALRGITPHFAVIDPTASGGTGPQSAAWMFFSHATCRTIVYSSNVRSSADSPVSWLIDKTRPPGAVVDAIVAAVNNPNWLDKGGEGVQPRQ